MTLNLNSFRQIKALIGIIFISLWFGLAIVVQAQGTISYSFSGNVTQMNPGSTLFPGVTVGTAIDGEISINYSATSSSPGQYEAIGFGFRGLIGGYAFGSPASATNSLSVSPGPTEDFVIFTSAQPTMPAGLSMLTLTFYDSTGQAINSDTLPAFGAALNSFPQIVLFGQGGGFGQYTFQASFDQTPEPSTASIGLVFIGISWFRAQQSKRK